MRINYRFIGFTVYKGDCGLWFIHNTNRWEYNPNTGKNGYSSHQPCRTVRAFRRKLKYAPKGISFILVSRWFGHDIIGQGSYEINRSESSNKCRQT